MEQKIEIVPGRKTNIELVIKRCGKSGMAIGIAFE
jgi:hypothetical protein